MNLNTFDRTAKSYSEVRPRYPAALYEWLIGECLQHDMVWDCATGNGQAALGVAPYFRQVCATDLSSEQIACAKQKGNISYSVSRAESTSFPDNYFDLIIVAQALHWFDFAKFWPEVRRVACPGAFFAAWGYYDIIASPEIEQKLLKPVAEILQPFWPPQISLLKSGYPPADMGFELERTTAPPFSLRMKWNSAELLKFISTWSAFVRCQSNPRTTERLTEAVNFFLQQIDPGEHFLIQMPLTILSGRTSSDT